MGIKYVIPRYKITYFMKKFQDINTNLKRYEFILIDKYNEYRFMRIRMNLNQIFICK